MAAAVHDVGHDGKVYHKMLSQLMQKNNAFHVALGTQRAIRFNMKSVQENYHANLASRLALSVNLFSGMSSCDAKYLRSLLVDLVVKIDSLFLQF